MGHGKLFQIFELKFLRNISKPVHYHYHYVNNHHLILYKLCRVLTNRIGVVMVSLIASSRSWGRAEVRSIQGL